jgi:aspartate/methionine/tyrosine aminotransferase
VAKPLECGGLTPLSQRHLFFSLKGKAASSRSTPKFIVKSFQPPRRLQGIQKSPIRVLHDRAKPGSINLGLGEPDLPTPDVIRQRAARIVIEEQNGYTTHAGLPTLREKVASEYTQLNLTQDNVIITAGSQEALYLSLMTLIDEGEEVLIPNPGFVAYTTIVRMAGGVPRFYRMPAEKDFGFDADEFRAALTDKIKVVVCISPSNPTGRVLSNEDMKAMADALKDTGAFVISDEIYRELYFTDERPPSISDYYPQRTIVINGLSKSMNMTGWRLGWLCGDADVIKSALVLHGYVTTCASTVSQKTALSYWTDEAEQARASFRQTFKERRDYLLLLIESELKLNATPTEGAFYTMVDFGRGVDSMKIAEAMLEEKVITVPGSAFGNESEGFLRVSFCANKEMLEEGVRRMKKALEKI